MLYNLTGSKKSNMAAFKPEVPISKLVNKIGTKVQRLYTCFRGQLPNDTIKNVVLPNRIKEIQYGDIQNGSTYI